MEKLQNFQTKRENACRKPYIPKCETPAIEINGGVKGILREKTFTERKAPARRKSRKAVEFARRKARPARLVGQRRKDVFIHVRLIFLSPYLM